MLTGERGKANLGRALQRYTSGILTVSFPREFDQSQGEVYFSLPNLGVFLSNTELSDRPLRLFLYGLKVHTHLDACCYRKCNECDANDRLGDADVI